MGWLPSPEWSYWRYCHRVPDQRQKAPEKKKKRQEQLESKRMIVN